MALCKFGHVSLVNKISQKLLKLEPWNLMNRLVVMSRWPDYAPSFEWNWWGILFCLHLSIRLFVRSSSFFCACHILRTLHARVLKFYIWVPNEKIADPYFYLEKYLSWVLEIRYSEWEWCVHYPIIFWENSMKILIKLRPFAVLLILTLSARFLEKHLS